MGKCKNKLIAALLAVMMLGSVMTGCGKAEEKESAATSSYVEATEESTSSVVPSEEPEEVLEPVHFVVWLNQGAGTDDAIVEKAFNELDAVKELNVTVDFVTVPTGDNFSQKLDLALAANEKVDIVLGDPGANSTTRMKSGAYADVSELLNTKYPALLDILMPEHWTRVTIDGGIYGIPSFKEPSAYNMFFIQKSVVDKYNLDLSNRTVMDLTDILEALKEDGRATFMMKYSEMSNLRDYCFEVDNIKLSRWFSSASYDDPRTVFNPYETEEFKDLCLLTKEWYDNGLIASDVLTKENFNTESNDENLYGLKYLKGDVLSLYRQEAATGFDLEEIQLTPDTSNMSNAGYNACINAKCENIDRALAFIELFYTDSDVKNMITYGIEGMHYELVNGQVDWTNYPDHATAWQTANARVGNINISYPTTGFPEEGHAVYEDSAKNARKNPLALFTVDTSAITNEINAVKAVEIEYVNMLMSGVVTDVEATIAEMNKKMYDNGMQKVIDEIQKQLDAFWAAK